MKRILTIVIIAALTSTILLSTNIGIARSNTMSPIIKNVYVTTQKIREEAVSQSDSSKSAQIAADLAKQEEINRIAKLGQGAVNSGKPEKSMSPELNPSAITDEETELERLAKIEADRLAKLEADRLKLEFDRLAKLEVDRLIKLEKERIAKLEADRTTLVLVQNQTVTGTKLSSYLNSSVRISSVLNRAVALHGGNPSNTCVYFSSEAMRRIGVAVPLATCNTGEYLSYLRRNAWITNYDIKKLTPGSICFTTSIRAGHPTHTFAFMGWVTSGSYSLAYVSDNQDNSVHIRNMGATYATDAFAFFMHTPTQPTSITAASSGYNSINVGWNSVNGSSIYGIYRATSSSGTYNLITSTKSTRYNNAGLTTNGTYFYKVRTYRMVGSVKQYSGLSDAISSKPMPSVPVNLKATRINSKNIKLTWSSVIGANGYEVYTTTSSKIPYSLLTDTASLFYTNSDLISGKFYYCKIRSYKIIDKEKVYGNFTAAIYAKS